MKHRVGKESGGSESIPNSFLEHGSRAVLIDPSHNMEDGDGYVESSGWKCVRKSDFEDGISGLMVLSR
jgi:hypothetical protein